MAREPLLPIDTALERLLAQTTPLPDRETIAIETAHGRITAKRVLAPMNVPPFTASAMDGYAVNAADPCFAGAAPYHLPVRGRSVAGAPASSPLLATDTAIRIFTGAPLPARADAVVLQENVQRDADTIVLAERPRAGAWVRPAGHDVPRGAELFDAGTRLRAFELGWLAACGLTSVAVTRPVRVALFSTGDELREPGQALAQGQIYESNRRVLRELMHHLPVEILDLGIVPDDEATIASMLADAAARADVVVTSGGVSVGEADHMRAALERVGSLEFWRLALKPGKPLAYGRIGSARFFGLPGNPVSTIVTFLLLVVPVIARLGGRMDVEPLRLRGRLTDSVPHDPGRAEYQRARFRTVAGRYVVTPTGDQSSNRLASFKDANCLLIVPSDAGDLTDGAEVELLPFEGLLG